MKFYSDKNNNNYHLGKIRLRKLTSIYIDNIGIDFFKNGKRHNSKNAACIDCKFKQFYLNGQSYGYEYNFTKQSWRRFVKLQAFL